MSQIKTPRSPLRPLPALIFASRWLQLPLYLGLIVAQGVYVWQFGMELVHLIQQVFSHRNEVVAGAPSAEVAIMLIVLGLIDVVMISNLLVMVIVGGYETFVSRLNLEGHPDQPDWLSHVNASVLKVKLAMAIIGISSIHLLKTFIEAGTVGMPVCTPELIAAQAACSKFTATGVMWQTIIHTIFILSAVGVAYTDRLMSLSASEAEKSAAH
ncbi:MAG: TIGR00645 family protein [Methylobacillus sp.]|jgi:uncharacterized protein (TIGR00645 family)|nr:TIGR00645 family protein [Methylobacillus sp.]